MTNQIKNPYKSYTAEEQSKAITSIGKRGQKLKKDTEQLVNGFLMKYNEDGDYTKIMVIADMIGDVFTKAARNAFFDWCIAYTKTLKWDDVNKTMVHHKRKNTGNGERLRTFTEQQGDTTVTTEHFQKSFFDFVIAKDAPRFKMIARLESLLKSAEKGIEEKNAEGYTRKDIAELRAFAEQKGWIENEAA